MARTCTALLVCVALGLLAGGCGGDGVDTERDTVLYTDGGVEVEGASGLQRVQIRTNDLSGVAFTGYYGAQITRLSQMGYERLALSTVRDGTSFQDICLLNEDGTGYTRLTTWPYAEADPAYSPSGAKILFHCSPGGNTEIYCMDADGSDIVRLTNMPGHDGQATWSPDGTRIAFTSQRSGDPDIWVMNADGTGAANITNAPMTTEYAPSWSPDGRRIAFATTIGGNIDIYAVNADGSYPVALTDDPASEQDPCWSPDGALIAFTSDRVGGVHHVYVMDADGSDEMAVTDGLVADAGPVFSPDGTRIAFQRGSDVCVVDPDTTVVRRVTEGAGTNGCPSWCPTIGAIRSLVGPVHSDGGREPPFGASRPLAILGANPRGLVEAATVDVLAALWSSVTMQALGNTGLSLTGVVIEAPQIDAVREDRGRGILPRVWSTPSPTGTRSAVVLFSARNGRITTVLASSTATLAAASRTARVQGDGTLVLEGSFSSVWGEDPSRNLAPGGAARVVIDAETGAPLQLLE